jgi:glycosyltransferase involved in cell wall biosynthesis
MIQLFLNALAASAGGGITYVRSVVPKLAARSDVRATVAVAANLRREIGPVPNIEFVETDAPVSTGARYLFEQRRLPALLRKSGADVLVSAGNFALRHSPVPQILLSRNALYTSADFLQDLWRRRDYRLWMDTRVKGVLAAASIRQADVTVAPSDAFAEELREWTGARILRIYHGFDAAAFRASDDSAPAELVDRLKNAEGRLRLLFVSHYNYYRNFETLFRALPILKRLISPRRVQLVLTCRLRSDQNPGSYQADSAAELLRHLGITGDVLELGSVPYRLLPHVYRACDVYVTPAYAESFAHPLVEAMSSGLPVVASDLAVHREICGAAGLYFARFSCEELANQVAKVSSDAGLAHTMSQHGQTRSKDFSWDDHIDQLLKVAKELMHSAPRPSRAT